MMALKHEGAATVVSRLRVLGHRVRPCKNMFRHANIDASGKPFDGATIEAVWSKATPSQEHPPLRVDALGALIWREGYGNTNSKFGWEIGYRLPPDKGGGDQLENLEPLQWENNRHNGFH